MWKLGVLLLYFLFLYKIVVVIFYFYVNEHLRQKTFFFFYQVRLTESNRNISLFFCDKKPQTKINTTLHKLDEFMHPVQGRAEVSGGFQPVHL